MTPFETILPFITLALFVSALVFYFFFLATDRRWMLPVSAVSLVAGFVVLAIQ